VIQRGYQARFLKTSKRTNEKGHHTVYQGRSGVGEEGNNLNEVPPNTVKKHGTKTRLANPQVATPLYFSKQRKDTTIVNPGAPFPKKGANRKKCTAGRIARPLDPRFENQRPLYKIRGGAFNV